MCGNINTNERASSNAGRMRLMLIQLQLLPFIQHTFFLPCSAAAILQTAKVRESYVKSLPCFQCCSQEISHWPFCIHTCVVAVIGSLKLCSKIILISHTNGTHFPVFFYPISPSLFWNFSKKRSYRNCGHEKMA